MRNVKLLWLAVLVLSLVPLSMAAGTDTLRFGANNEVVYQDSEGRVCVPLFLHNPAVAFQSVGLPTVVSTTGGPFVVDSFVLSERSMACSDYLLFGAYCPEPLPVTTDSLAVMVVPNCELAPGRGPLAYLWLTGPQAGDIISFNFIAEHRCQFSAAMLGYGWGEAAYAPTNLLVQHAPVTTSLEPVYAISQFHQMRLPVQVYGGAAPFTLEVLSFEGDNAVSSPPTVIPSGDGFVIDWTPFYNTAGNYNLVLRAGDAAGGTVELTVRIIVAKSNPSGDMNCDGIVDLKDLSRLIAWMTMGVGRPVCPAD